MNLTDGLAGRLDAVRDDIAAEIRRARESYNRSEQGDRLEDIRRRHGIGSGADGRAHQGNRARAGPEREHPDRRPRHDHHPADQRGGRRPAPHPRLGHLHPRPDAGTDHRHPGTGQRRAAARHHLPGDGEALPAPLQLPALLGGRGAPDAWPRPSRDRPRRAGRARARAGAAERGGVPVHHPRRVGGGEQQRLDQHGEHLRQHPVADGRRRADQGAGGRCGDGPDHRSGDRPLRGADRHHRQGRRVRRHGLQGGRHRRWRDRAADGHQGRRHHQRDAAGCAGAGAPGAAAHPGQDDRGHQRQPRAS